MMTATAQPPEGGTEVRVRPVLGRVEPERPGDVRPTQRMVVQRDEREDPLRTRRQLQRSAVALQRERVQEPQADAGHLSARCFGRSDEHNLATAPLLVETPP